MKPLSPWLKEQEAKVRFAHPKCWPLWTAGVGLFQNGKPCPKIYAWQYREPVGRRLFREGWECANADAHRAAD